MDALKILKQKIEFKNEVERIADDYSMGFITALDVLCLVSDACRKCDVELLEAMPKVTDKLQDCVKMISKEFINKK